MPRDTYGSYELNGYIDADGNSVQRCLHIMWKKGSTVVPTVLFYTGPKGNEQFELAVALEEHELIELERNIRRARRDIFGKSKRLGK